MIENESQRRPRGASPRGDFEEAKTYASASEDARVTADRKKTEKLKSMRLAATKPTAAKQ